MKTINMILIAILFGAIAGTFSIVLIEKFDLLDSYEKSQNELIKEFYEVENAVHVSPHSIRKHIDDGTFVLVDLRSQQEYENEHVIGAVNIPAYKDPDTSAYGDVERIVNSFKELKQNNPNKDIIVYCYSTPCMTGRKIGLMLTENDIYVKHLGIGWNEWRYYWGLWNHEHELNQTNVMDYVTNGSEPGKFDSSKEIIQPCAINNEFGC